MTEHAIPFEALDAAADELGVPQMQEALARKDALLASFADAALAEVADHPANTAIKAAELLHHADREHAVSGQLPEETHSEAIDLAHAHHRQKWQRKIAAEREQGRGIA